MQTITTSSPLKKPNTRPSSLLMPESFTALIMRLRVKITSRSTTTNSTTIRMPATTEARMKFIL